MLFFVNRPAKERYSTSSKLLKLPTAVQQNVSLLKLNVVSVKTQFKRSLIGVLSFRSKDVSISTKTKKTWHRQKLGRHQCH
jgi:hypothetical protein